ncbi:hypothetical protein SDC9_138840 [bioreactor metagenome]|uniref:Uncharacterized protein n=1 Tax=bioreactor metagenome TaxID=1076179 RepID=A0A645DRF4_9ZZZZ
MVALRISFVHKGTVSADEVHAGGLSGSIQGLCKQNILLTVAAFGNHRNGCYRNALVDDGDPVFAFDHVACFYKVFGLLRDLVINLLRGNFYIAVTAVPKGDSHCDGSDIQIFIRYHFGGFQYIVYIDHATPLNFMHGVEDIFMLYADGKPKFFSKITQIVRKFSKANAAFGYIHQCDHDEHILHDCLGNVQYIYIRMEKNATHMINDPHRIGPDDSDDCFHKKILLFYTYLL